MVRGIFITTKKIVWSNLAGPMHLFRTASHPQVVPGADGPEVVAQTTKQASFCVTLLLATLVRERTFQEIVGLHVFYCCMVVLWPGRLQSGTLHHA